MPIAPSLSDQSSGVDVALGLGGPLGAAVAEAEDCGVADVDFALGSGLGVTLDAGLGNAPFSKGDGDGLAPVSLVRASSSNLFSSRSRCPSSAALMYSRARSS